MPTAVIAHRGASGTRPENTLVAFRRAAELGADMIELDVQLSRDDAVVVIHDRTLDRTTDGRGAVRGRTLAELRRLDAGRWFGDAYAGEPVPALAEVLDAVALPINVELKPNGADGLEARALEVVARAGAIGRVVFSSFDAASLVRLRQCTEAATIAVLWGGSRLAAPLHTARRVGARALHVRKEAVSAAMVRKARAAGLAVRVWTVNEAAEFAHLRSLGVDGVFTDFPERFLQNR